MVLLFIYYHLLSLLLRARRRHAGLLQLLQALHPARQTHTFFPLIFFTRVLQCCILPACLPRAFIHVVLIHPLTHTYTHTHTLKVHYYFSFTPSLLLSQARVHYLLLWVWRYFVYFLTFSYFFWYFTYLFIYLLIFFSPQSRMNCLLSDLYLIKVTCSL